MVLLLLLKPKGLVGLNHYFCSPVESKWTGWHAPEVEGKVAS